MQEVKILRLTTGEDVIAKVGENDQGVSLNKAFVIIPQQTGPGKPIQLMMSLYNAFGKSETITLANNNTVTMTSGYANPELQPDSGNIIYLENRRPIQRASDQTEDIKIIIEF